MDFFDFDESDKDILFNLKTERINVNYYLKKPSLIIDIEKIKSFVLKCKEIVSTLNDDQILNIRKQLTDMIKKSKN